MKKFISMLTALTLVIAMFCACSSPEEEKQPQDNNKQTINEPSSKEDVVDKETPVVEEQKPVVEEEKPVSSKETVSGTEKVTPLKNGFPNPFEYIDGISGGFTSYYSDLDSNFTGWACQFEHAKMGGTRPPEEFTIINFINERNISKEAFIAATKEARKFYASINSDYRIYGILTYEEIEIIYSKDMKKINQTFVNPDAILIDDKIYSPKWISEHSIKECEAVGITKEMLAEKLPEWEQVNIVRGNKLTELKAYANVK